MVSRTINNILNRNDKSLKRISQGEYFYITSRYSYIEVDDIKTNNFNIKSIQINDYFIDNAFKYRLKNAIASATIEGNVISNIGEYNKAKKEDKREIKVAIGIEEYLEDEMNKNGISHRLLSDIHAEFKGVKNLKGVTGEYKKQQNYVENGYLPCDPLCVKNELDKFFIFFNQKPENFCDGLLKSGIVHAWFERIHPFADGNGRLEEFLLNITYIFMN